MIASGSRTAIITAKRLQSTSQRFLPAKHRGQAHGQSASGSKFRMVWPFGSRISTSEDSKDEAESTKRPVSWSESLGRAEADPLGAAKEWAPVVGFSLVGLGALQLYANYLRRIPGAAFIRPSFFRTRSLFGRVTGVGDGDGFHLFHTPGGKAVGWGWLRKVPETRKELKDRTVGPFVE